MPSGLKIGEAHNVARYQADRNGRQADAVDLGRRDQRSGDDHDARQALVEPVPSPDWNCPRLPEQPPGNPEGISTLSI